MYRYATVNPHQVPTVWGSSGVRELINHSYSLDTGENHSSHVVGNRRGEFLGSYLKGVNKLIRYQPGFREIFNVWTLFDTKCIFRDRGMDGPTIGDESKQLLQLGVITLSFGLNWRFDSFEVDATDNGTTAGWLQTPRIKFQRPRFDVSRAGCIGNIGPYRSQLLVNKA